MIFKHVEYHFLFQNGSSSTFSTANPGYLQGAEIIAGIGNGNGSAIQYDINSFFFFYSKTKQTNLSCFSRTASSSQFSVLQPASDGSCDSTVERIPIVFGENIRTTCKYK